jgi:hypothetical protein
MTQLSIAIVLAALIVGVALVRVSDRYVVGSQPGYIWRLERKTGDLFVCGVALPDVARTSCNRMSIQDSKSD